MCTPIYYVHNVTLWSCPQTIVCPTTYLQQLNSSQFPSSAPSAQSSPTPSAQSSHNVTSNWTVTGGSSVTPSASITPGVGTAPSIINMSPSSSSAPTPSLIMEITSDSTQNLRHPNRSNHTLEQSVACVCESNLDYLHIFWIVPLTILLFCCLWFRRRAGVKITTMYQRSRSLRRSRSWPEMSERKSPIQNRAHSSPPFDSIVL